MNFRKNVVAILPIFLVLLTPGVARATGGGDGFAFLFFLMFVIAPFSAVMLSLGIASFVISRKQDLRPGHKAYAFIAFWLSIFLTVAIILVALGALILLKLRLPLETIATIATALLFGIPNIVFAKRIIRRCKKELPSKPAE